jgi:hypothetical protein
MFVFEKRSQQTQDQIAFPHHLITPASKEPV